MSSLKEKMKPAGSASQKPASVGESFRSPVTDETVTKPLNVRVSEELKTEIKLYAAAKDIKLQDLVTLAVSEYMERHP